MISKEVLKVSKEISKFGANHVTVPIFASIVFFTIKEVINEYSKSNFSLISFDLINL